MRKSNRVLWQFLLRVIGQRVGRCVLILVGVIVIGAAFWQPNGGDPLALLALSLGVLMVVLGCLIPWLVSASAGASGVSVQIRDRPVESNELTTLFAESASVEAVRGADGQAGVEGIALARYLAADRALAAWFSPVDGPLVGCSLRLFLYDSNRGRLLPALAPDETESEGWAPGQGVTGEAYRTGDYVLATGKECSDSTYGLTVQQQARYAHLTAVASSPLWTAADEVIGALSASSSDPEPSLASNEGHEELIFLAALTARILIDLLGWFADGSDENAG